VAEIGPLDNAPHDEADDRAEKKSTSFAFLPQRTMPATSGCKFNLPLYFLPFLTIYPVLALARATALFSNGVR
jgi:hypothetical protein